MPHGCSAALASHRGLQPTAAQHEWQHSHSVFQSVQRTKEHQTTRSENQAHDSDSMYLRSSRVAQDTSRSGWRSTCNACTARAASCWRSPMLVQSALLRPQPAHARVGDEERHRVDQRHRQLRKGHAHQAARSVRPHFGAEVRPVAGREAAAQARGQGVVLHLPHVGSTVTCDRYGSATAA